MIASVLLQCSEGPLFAADFHFRLAVQVLNHLVVPSRQRSRRFVRQFGDSDQMLLYYVDQLLLFEARARK